MHIHTVDKSVCSNCFEIGSFCECPNTCKECGLPIDGRDHREVHNGLEDEKYFALEADNTSTMKDKVPCEVCIELKCFCGHAETLDEYLERTEKDKVKNSDVGRTFSNKLEEPVEDAPTVKDLPLPLDLLAQEEVGKPDSEYIFITSALNVVIAVFSTKSFSTELVIAIAKALPIKDIYVENHTGCAWDNVVAKTSEE